MFCKIVSFSQLREEKVSCLLMIQSVVFLTRNSFVLFGQNCLILWSVSAGWKVAGRVLFISRNNSALSQSRREGERERKYPSLGTLKHPSCQKSG